MATGTNVMSLAPGSAQSGKGRQVSGDGRAAAARTAGRGRAASQKNGKFGDVLEQTQDINDLPKESMGAADEAVDLPKDPIAAAIAATSQSKQQESKAASGEHDTTEQPDQAKVSAVKEDTVPSVKTQVESGMADLVLETPARNEVLSANLQTLLPQSDEVFEKGKSMLDILSGRGWKQSGRQGNNQTVGVVEVNETASRTIDLPDSQMANGTRFMGMFQNRAIDASQKQVMDASNPQVLDISQGKPTDIPKTQVMWTVQDARGVSDQQIQQLAINEAPQQMQQGTQANRPQAQPGMQGMPVMQDAQASLTRPMQNENVPQNVRIPADKQNLVYQDAPTPLEAQLNPEIETEIPQRFQGIKNPAPSENPTSGAIPTKTEQESVSRTQGFAIPQDRIQQIDRRQDVFNFNPVEKMPQSEDVLEKGTIAAEEVLEQVPTATSTAAEPIRGRQELRRESTAFQEAGNAETIETIETEKPMESFSKMMHGQEQGEDGRQQSEERRPMTGQQASVLSEGVGEGREANRANVRQQAQEPVLQEPVIQPSPQHQQPVGFQQTLNTAQAQASEGTQPPMASAQEFDIPGQIVEQARLIRNSGNTEMVMHLKPEHLGDLTLRVSVSEHGAVTASFHSDNAQVRAIIEHSLVQLKQELSNQGIKVDNVEVYAGLSDDGLLNGQSQQAWQQNQQDGSRRNRSFDMEAFEEESGELSATPEYEGAEEGVDYRV